MYGRYLLKRGCSGYSVIDVLGVCTIHVLSMHRTTSADLKVYVCVGAKLLQSCAILCNHMDCSPPDSSVHGILLARITGRIAMPFSRGSSRSRDPTHISYVFCNDRQVLYH